MCMYFFSPFIIPSYMSGLAKSRFTAAHYSLACLIFPHSKLPILSVVPPAKSYFVHSYRTPWMQRPQTFPYYSLIRGRLCVDALQFIGWRVNHSSHLTQLHFMFWPLGMDGMSVCYTGTNQNLCFVCDSKIQLSFNLTNYSVSERTASRWAR